MGSKRTIILSLNITSKSMVPKVKANPMYPNTMQALSPQSLPKINPYAHNPFIRITVDIIKGINALALLSYSSPNIVYEELKPKMSEPT